MEKKVLGNRKIKCIGKCIDNNDSFLHPITLTIIKNTKDEQICPTNIYTEKNKILINRVCLKNENVDKQDISNYMSLPYINLDIKVIINIYKVETIDKLEEWFDNNINKDTSYDSINRILNIWIKLNFDIVKNFHDIFENFYLKINSKFWNYKNKNIKKELDKYMNKWFKIKKDTDFILDLGNDLKKYLSK